MAGAESVGEAGERDGVKLALRNEKFSQVSSRLESNVNP